MPDVEVGLGAVVGDEHLAVLERVHRAGVDVEVRVELLHRDPQPARAEQATEAGGRESLAERGGDAPGDEDVLGRLLLHGIQPYQDFRRPGPRHDQSRRSERPRAAPGRAPSRCRTPRARPASGTAPGRRPASSSAVSPEVVTDPSLLLRTTTWWSANAATCGRWVTTSTCADRASAARRRPISTAALPPTPASTSSKTNVGTGRVSASDDLDRQHDPGQLAARRRPCRADAARSRCWRPSEQLDLVDAGRGEPPAAAVDLESVLVGAPGRHGRRSRACGIDSGASSAVTAAPSRSAACADAARRAGRPGRPASSAAAARSARSCVDALVGAIEPDQRVPPRPGSTRAPRRASRRTCGSATVSAARRSETAASRAGSVSTPAA